MSTRLASIAACAIVLAATPALVGLPPGAAHAQTATPAPAPLAAATVRAVQEALNREGIAAPLDGVLDDATRAALRQYQSQHHLPVTGEADAATLAKLGVAAAQAPDGSAATGTPAPAQGAMMPRMQPMMPMMQQNMAGTAGRGAPMTGMAQGAGSQAGMRMAGDETPPPAGMAMCPTVESMMSMRRNAMQVGPMTTEWGIGPALLYGMPRHARAPLSPERVRTMLERMLSWHGNERLRVGELQPTDLGEVLAEIVTRDGSLVQRLAVDRRTGGIRQVD